MPVPDTPVPAPSPMAKRGSAASMGEAAVLAIPQTGPVIEHAPAHAGLIDAAIGQPGEQQPALAPEEGLWHKEPAENERAVAVSTADLASSWIEDDPITSPPCPPATGLPFPDHAD